MTRIALYEDPIESESLPFRAIAGHKHAQGRTAGEALDALALQLSPEASETLVIIRKMRPDRFFNADQRKRLEELIASNREAMARSSTLSPDQAAELESLIEEELQATNERARAMLIDLAP